MTFFAIVAAWLICALACETFGHFQPGRHPRLLPLTVAAPFYFVAQAIEGIDGYWFNYTEPRGFWPGMGEEKEA